MDGNLVYALAAGIGFAAGLRSMTAPAATALAAHLGWLKLQGSPLEFMSSSVTVGILTLFALGELVADKLPQTPNRTSLPGLVTRIATGAVSGACICIASDQPLAAGAVLGGLTGIAGAFAGHEARKRTVAALGTKDTYIAAAEDVIAISLALLLVSRIA
jgi:uncharacterized membrane protein